MVRRSALSVGALALVVGVALFPLLAGCSSGVGPPPASLGLVQDRAVPASVAGIPLYGPSGRRTDLAGLKGKVALIAPFMTLCTEMCPITTGELGKVVAALRTAGLEGKVAVIEISIDPGRDTPERLSAYAKMAGATWPLLTTTPPSSTPPSPLPSAPSSALANLASIARFFGWLHQTVPEGSPPATDWWTGKPLTYDVDHSDGFVLLDRSGRVRFETVAPATTGGVLKGPLRSILDSQGLHNLASPASTAWTVADALDAIGWLRGSAIPGSS